MLLGLLVIFAYLRANAQDDTDLREYEDFFRQKETAFQEWMQKSELNKYIIYERLEVRKKKVNIVLRSSAWDALSDSTKKQMGISLDQLLMNKSLFIFNLEPEQVLIKVDQGLQTLFIEYEGTDVNIKLSSSYRKNQGTVTGNLEVEVGQLNLPESETYTTDQTIDILKKKLHKALDEYFKEKEVKWKFGDYSLKPYFKMKNQLKIKVRNVQNIVERGYYEAINIDFFFTEANGKVSINYTLNCKYGSGILFSPFEEDYLEVDKKKMENFDNDLQEMILTALIP